MMLRTKPIAKYMAMTESMTNEYFLKVLPDQAGEKAYEIASRHLNWTDICRDLIDSPDPITKVNKVHGATRLKMKKAAIELLQNSSSMVNMITPMGRIPFALQPDVEHMLIELNQRREFFGLAPEELEAMVRTNPKIVHDCIEGFMVDFRRNAGTTRQRLAAYEHRRSHNAHYTEILKTFKAQVKLHAGARIVQVDLMGPPLEHFPAPPLHQEVAKIFSAHKTWQSDVQARLAKDRLVEAYQLMVSPRGLRIHCAFMVNNHSADELVHLIEFMRQAWSKNYPDAEFFNPNFPGSPFEFRGMCPEVAEGYPLTNRIENVAVYLVRPVEMIGCEQFAGFKYCGLQSRDMDRKPKLGHTKPRSSAYSEFMAKAAYPQPSLGNANGVAAKREEAAIKQTC